MRAGSIAEAADWWAACGIKLHKKIQQFTAAGFLSVLPVANQEAATVVTTGHVEPHDVAGVSASR